MKQKLRDKNKLNEAKRNFTAQLQCYRKRYIWRLATILLICGVLATAAAHRLAYTQPTQPAQAASPVQREKYIRKTRISPHLRQILSVVGDRLEKPGKERLVFTGSLTSFTGTNQQTRSFRLISEFPGKLRLEEQLANRVQVTVFNGGDAWTSNGSAEKRDLDVIETLAFDSVDAFFDAKLQGAASRLLGNRFRLDGGDNEDYPGPYYDIYQLVRQIRIGPEARQQLKLYYFNSDTLLLERVKYELERDGSPLTVEIELGNWTTVNGQSLPGTITRRENGVPVMTLTIAAAAVISEQNDGSFGRP